MSYVKYVEGVIVKNSQNDEFKILEVVSNLTPPRFVVESLKTGFIIEISRSALYCGRYLDRLKPSLYGVGIMGYAENFTQQEVDLWRGMLNRCHNKKSDSYKYYGEKGVKVCSRWQRFDYFLEDLPKIAGYNKNLFEAKQLQLDKDILQEGVVNKIYSLATCVFTTLLTNSINTSRNRLFYCLTPDGKIESHKVVKFYAQEHQLDDSSIHKCLKKHRKSQTCCGYFFSYDLKEVQQKQCERLSKTLQK